MSDTKAASYSKGLFYLVAAGCLVALTVSLCGLMGKIGWSSQELVRIEQSRARSEQAAGSLMMEASAWLGVNLMAGKDLAGKAERDEISQLAIQNVTAVSQSLGKVLALLDRQAGSGKLFPPTAAKPAASPAAADAAIEDAMPPAAVILTPNDAHPAKPRKASR